MKKGLLGFFLFAVFFADAQPRTISIEEAVQLGIQNSASETQTFAKQDRRTLARLDQAKDAALPSAKVSFQYLHALMLSRVINLPNITKEPIKLPFDFPAYLRDPVRE